jgi:predicted MPP superfamily phosphohydrolase
MKFGLIGLAIFILVLVLLFLAQRFWFRSLWKFSNRFRHPWLRTLIRGLATLVLVAYVVALLSRILGRAWFPHGWLTRETFAAIQLWLFASFFAYLFFIGVRVLERAWLGGKRLVTGGMQEPVNESRRSFFRYAARLAAAVPLVAAVYGYSAERFRYRVRRVEVPVAGLPSALDGLKIVQLSDIHIGDFMPREEVRRAVEMANNLGANMAVVTGDFITGPADPLAACVEELSRLRAPMGVWGCNGNHEIYADAEEEAQRLFALHGMKLLRQERAELNWKNSKLNLIGVDYQRDHMVHGSKPPMLEGVEGLVRRDMPNILLSHNPNSFNKAAELGIELSLAGHTHGGQVQVEILDQHVNPARFVTQFIAGLYDLPLNTFNGSGSAKRAALYVNRGLGTIGVPARLGVDPEISLLTLRQG